MHAFINEFYRYRIIRGLFKIFRDFKIDNAKLKSKGIQRL